MLYFVQLCFFFKYNVPLKFELFFHIQFNVIENMMKRGGRGANFIVCPGRKIPWVRLCYPCRLLLFILLRWRTVNTYSLFPLCFVFASVNNAVKYHDVLNQELCLVRFRSTCFSLYHSTICSLQLMQVCE